MEWTIARPERAVVVLALVILNSLQTFAKVKVDCEEMQAEQVRLGLTGKNLANAETTRTPAGGAYRPFRIKSCAKGSCTGTLQEEPVLKYLPGHPDADKNGYVAFPNVDPKAEFKIFNMTAAKLKSLAASKACGAHVFEAKTGSSFAVRYKNEGDSSVKEDIINMDRKNRVTSWMRQENNGASTTINFDADGRVQSNVRTE